MNDFRAVDIYSRAVSETFAAEVEASQGLVDEHRAINVEHLLLMLEPDSCLSPAIDKYEHLKTFDFKNKSAE